MTKVKIRVFTVEGEGAAVDWVAIAAELASMSRASIEEQRTRKPPIARPPRQRPGALTAGRRGRR